MTAEVDSAVLIRPASTVILLRDTPAGLEVFVLRRVPGMVFAPGSTVFPGGGVDTTDEEPDIPWRGPDADWWADRLGTGAAAARALVVAAVRELFEEAGVLLAGSHAAWPAPEMHRAALASHSTGLAALLRETGQELRADLLRPWANWITPAGGTRRYDTFFFVAALPGNAVAGLTTTEADDGRWARPGDLLTEFANGTIDLLPPTVVMLTDLSGFGSTADVLATSRAVQPVHAVVLRGQPGPLRIRVGDLEYTVGRKVPVPADQKEL